MYYLKYNNENIFIQKINKIILTSYKKYYEFLRSLKYSDNYNIELNGFNMNSKNTILIDFSSVSTVVDIFSNNTKIIDEYIKYKISNINLQDNDEKTLDEILSKYIYENIPLSKNEELDVDYLKLLKNCLNVKIENNEDLFEIINEITKIETIKQVIIIYKRNILNSFKLHKILDLKSEKIIMFEICDKESYLSKEDNILFFNQEITQITVNDLFGLIMEKLNINSDEVDVYEYLINKIFFYSIDKKEVDIMKKYNKILEELVQIIEERFNLNLDKTSEIC